MGIKGLNCGVQPCLSLRNQSGAAMLETVVSLFILAIGLLGSLAMQANGVNSNQRAHLITDANILAMDMADRIMAYNSDDITGDNDDYDGISTADAVSQPSCLASGCSAGDQKTYDHWDWAQQIKTRLPGGLGKVDYDGASGTYSIQVMWNHEQIENPTTNCNGASTDLTCFTYELRL